MSLGYSDLQDLIQNQRALAEMVNQIKSKYDEFEIDIDFAKELDGKLHEMNATLTTTLSNFDTRIADSDARMKKALQDAKDTADTLASYVNTLQLNSDEGPVTIQHLVSVIEVMTTLVYKGVEQPDGTWTGGLEDLWARLEALEEKSPPLVIMRDGEDIPVEDRVDGVLYGRVTSEVTDIESGQVIKISPYLQGVVVD